MYNTPLDYYPYTCKECKKHVGEIVSRFAVGLRTNTGVPIALQCYPVNNPGLSGNDPLSSNAMQMSCVTRYWN